MTVFKGLYFSDFLRSSRTLGILLIAPWIVLFASCSMKEPTAEERIPTQSLTQAEKLVQSASVTCESDACHPSVGLVAIADLDFASRCTGFLVAPNMILTNSHCIPADITPSSACDKRIRIVFPDGESATCSQVISKSQLSLQKFAPKPDYAFIRLDGSLHRPVLQIEKEGAPEGMLLKVVKMDPLSQKELTGVIRISECVAVHATALVRRSSPESAITILGDCPIISGNSGSPAIDEDGKVRLLVQNFLSPKQGSVPALGDLLEPLSPLAVTTNLACVDNPLIKPAAPFRESCSAQYYEPTSHETDEALERRDRNMKSDLETRLRSFRPVQLEMIEWESPDLNQESLFPPFVYRPVPRCFLEPDHWIKSYLTQDGLSSIAKIKETLPEFEIRLGRNRYLQLSHRLIARPPVSAVLEFSPESLVENRNSLLSLSAPSHRSPAAPAQTLFERVLKICADSF